MTFPTRPTPYISRNNSVTNVATTTASADGALTATAGGQVMVTKAGVCAMTLPNPIADGCTLVVIAATANAHTLTYTGGFGGAGTGQDVATFGGAINDSITLRSYNSLWYVVSTRNVTVA